MIQSGFLRGAILLVMAGVVAACGDSRPGLTGSDGRRVSLSLVNTDGSALLLDPRTANLEVGFGILVSANITGPDGQPIAGARATWRSTNESVVRVTSLPDSGFLTDGSRASVGAFAVGSAKVIASYGGVSDTATITVSPRSGQPSDTIFHAFNMGVFVSTAFDTTMFALWRREAVVGATVRLVQLPLLPGDTLPPEFPQVSEPTLLRSAVTDADGFVLFNLVPMSRYRLEVQPPAGSAWHAGTMDYGPPYTLSDVRFEIRLEKD